MPAVLACLLILGALAIVTSGIGVSAKWLLSSLYVFYFGRLWLHYLQRVKSIEAMTLHPRKGSASILYQNKERRVVRFTDKRILPYCLYLHVELQGGEQIPMILTRFNVSVAAYRRLSIYIRYAAQVKDGVANSSSQG